MTHDGRTALVVLGDRFPDRVAEREFGTIVADAKFKKNVEDVGSRFVELGSLVTPGSVYEANEFLEELSHVTLPDGTRVAKSFLYKGYELWWIHYNDLFRFICLPYTQYKDLLSSLTGFKRVCLYRVPHPGLFSMYLRAHGVEVVLREEDLKSQPLPFGVFIQMLLTLVSLPVLMVRRPRVMVYTGDKFAKGKDYDFRVTALYEELRGRGVRFVEFVRSLEPWRAVTHNFFVRRRAVMYPEVAVFLGKFFSVISGGRARGMAMFDIQSSHTSSMGPEEQFKLSAATAYLRTVYDDIWAIRVMRLILRITGVRAAFIPAANERNFNTVLACKLLGIPTVGIMHGVASPYSTPYDFMSGFDGEKQLSVDMYGVWSEWWREYYLKNSSAYKSSQLVVSGPMRPLGHAPEVSRHGGVCKVLFVAEQNAVPGEVMPYLRALIESPNVEVTIKFRPYRDLFEEWLKENAPDILQKISSTKATMQEALAHTDVAVGSHSTGVLEALLQLRAPVFFRTRKWGDYYTFAQSPETRDFFVETPAQLVLKVLAAREAPRDILAKLRERYFGNPHKNGSAWVVDALGKYLGENPKIW